MCESMVGVYSKINLKELLVHNFQKLLWQVSASDTAAHLIQLTADEKENKKTHSMYDMLDHNLGPACTPDLFTE
jgi:hypothetical protein